MAQATGPTLELFERSEPARFPKVERIRISPNGMLVAVSRREPDEDLPVCDERYAINWHEFDNLTGRLLTLCDATFTDPVQRKAFKDRVRQDIKTWVADLIVVAAADAGEQRAITTPFVGGVLNQVGGLFGVEGQPTP